MNWGVNMTIQDLLPILQKGWVACDEGGGWWWFSRKPALGGDCWVLVDAMFGADYKYLKYALDDCCFKCDIQPFTGDWKDSLIEIK